eukprot:Gb_34322 [translate_table: standard]
MIRAGFKLDVVTYNIIVNAFCKNDGMNQQQDKIGVGGVIIDNSMSKSFSENDQVPIGGAISKILNDAMDEIQKGARFVNADKITNPLNNNHALLLNDDGKDDKIENQNMNNDFKNNNKITEVKSGHHWSINVDNKMDTRFLFTILQCLLQLNVVRERYVYHTISIHGDVSLKIELLFVERVVHCNTKELTPPNSSNDHIKRDTNNHNGDATVQHRIPTVSTDLQAIQSMMPTSRGLSGGNSKAQADSSVAKTKYIGNIPSRQQQIRCQNQSYLSTPISTILPLSGDTSSQVTCRLEQKLENSPDAEDMQLKQIQLSMGLLKNAMGRTIEKGPGTHYHLYTKTTYQNDILDGYMVLLITNGKLTSIEEIGAMIIFAMRRIASSRSVRNAIKRRSDLIERNDSYSRSTCKN